MESTHQETVNLHTLLYQVFGSTRAEWLGEQLYELFAEPRYFPELQTNRPCFLVGGRGTGKTTALKGLSYEGQAALRPSSDPMEWNFYGLYHRVNTNRVTAFSGDELTDARWSRLFGHYLNLTFTLSVVTFLGWLQQKTDSVIDIASDDLQLVARSLGITEPIPDLPALGKNVRIALVDFEATVNNVVDAVPPLLSMLGAPLDQLIGSLRKLPEFEGKIFFLLIDEYENYLPYQQRLVNTLVKHAGDAYTVKVGVRQLGWKVRATQNPDEQLMYPADYALVEVEDRLEGDYFKEFATQVCQGRLDLLARRLDTCSSPVDSLLPGISDEDEARLLGIDAEIRSMQAELTAAGEHFDELEQMPELKAYLLRFWSRAQKTSLVSEIQDFKKDPSNWETRYQNYKHALLYTLRRGRGAPRKYYAGWDTFLLISNSNIRYALELVYESLKQNPEEAHTLVPVPPASQTAAAQAVGTRALKELEGVSTYGAQLTKLVLGLGRVFSVMASQAEGHAPEVNQFHFNPDSSPPTCRQKGLLDAAVMHLAFIRKSGTKLSEQSSTQEFDYWLNPVFAPFFIYSHRRKRKMQLDYELLEGLVDRPRPTIRRILATTNRSIDDELPEQLQMFDGYDAIS
jgi:hypothetical protein